MGDVYALLLPLIGRNPLGWWWMIESLARGTPVIAYRQGSVPEVLEDGVSGYIVDNLDAAT